MEDCIIVTGAAGFIGSCMTALLNRSGEHRLILADDFNEAEKSANLAGKPYLIKVHRDELFPWLAVERPNIACFYHLGARTDTTEFDYSIHERLNLRYSIDVWEYCADHGIPLVYASSAATYGDGSLGYSDNHGLVDHLQPLNPYGVSKNEFDRWALRQERHPPSWYGLKFFNVYGPNEYHKGRMASVVYHAHRQIAQRGYVELFRSHRADYADGGQLRDFIYVADVVRVCAWLMRQRPGSGIYNLGTGRARSFEDLALATFSAMGIRPDIRYIDMPADIRDRYQYFTQADMSKLRAVGYTDEFHTLEDGVSDYMRQYLIKGLHC